MSTHPESPAGYVPTEYEEGLLSDSPTSTILNFQPESDLEKQIHQGANQVPQQTSRLSGKHIVFIGDSISRYQYLNLAHHIAYGSAPTFEYYENDDHWKMKDLESFSETWWANWYDSTNRILNAGTSKEICDCYRKNCCDDSFENRYFTYLPSNTSLTYIQWFRDSISIKGHWSPNASGLSCQAGQCSSPAFWSFSQQTVKGGIGRFLDDFVFHLTPTPSHVVMNRAKWGHLSENDFGELLKEGHDLHKKHGTKFIWKTATHTRQKPDSEDGDTKREISMAGNSGWDVFDTHNLTQVLYSVPWAYRDDDHVSEIVNSYFNHALLNML